MDKNSIRFSWFNDNSILWRTNLAILARELGFKDFSDFSARFGSGWAYHLAPLSKMWVPTNGIKSSMVKLRIVLQVKSFLDIVKRGAKSVFATRLAMQRAQLALLN